jgi:TolC family type I secretion outer membrane protein
MSRVFRDLYLLLLVPALLASSSFANAQEPLTLGEAVHLALRQNPAFQTSEDEADAARARVGEARAGWFPRIDFSQGFTRGDNPVYVFGTLLTQRSFTAADFGLSSLNTPLPLDNFQTRFDGQMSLFDSGRTWFRVQGAKRLRTAAEFQTEQARQDLILEVVRAYYGVLVSRENAAAASDALGVAESNEKRIKDMRASGLVVDSDVLSARVFVAQMKDREIRAKNRAEVARLVLARELGLAPDARPEPSESLTEPAELTKTLQEWEQFAMNRRPALRAAELQQDAATSGKKAARAEFGPRLDLYADFERDALTLGGPSGTNWTAGARLDFNLFAGGAQRSRLAEAQANASKAKHNLEWFRSGVLLEVREAYLDATAAAQRAAAARDSADQARESLRIIQNRYEAGLTTITELLRAQAAQLDARSAYLSALYDWHLARAQLERSAGSLTTDSALLRGGRSQ